MILNQDPFNIMKPVKSKFIEKKIFNTKYIFL